MRRRRFRGPDVEPERAHRVNEDIRISQVRVIGPDGEQAGIMHPDEGRALAREHGLDLVEVAPTARPPVCRVMDYGKYKYQQAKRSPSNAAKTSLKTVQLRPKTDDHDLDTKLNRARRFLARGDKVRLVMRLRGRERALTTRWAELMRQHAESLAPEGTIANPPRPDGRVVTMLMEPTGAQAE